MKSKLVPVALLIIGVVVSAISSFVLRQPAIKESNEYWWLWLILFLSSSIAGVGLFLMEKGNRSDNVHFDSIPTQKKLPRLLGWMGVAIGVAITGWVVVRLLPNYYTWQGTFIPWLSSLLIILLSSMLIKTLGRASPRFDGSDNAKSPHERLILIPFWMEITFFFIIFFFGIFLRTYLIDQIPAAIYVDETNGSLDALNILEGSNVTPFGTGWYEMPNGYAYYMAGIYKLFGVSYASLKAISLIPALLTLPALYLLARYLFGAYTALISMYLLAISRWHMTMSRWGWCEIMPPLFQVMGTYFLFRGLRERKAVYFALGGIISGLTIYTYLSSRLVLLTLFLFAVYWILSDRDGLIVSFKKHWNGLLLFGIAACVAMAPIGVTYVTNPFTFFNRSAEINIFNEVREQQSLRPLGDNVWGHVKLFYQTGDPTGRQNIPGEAQTDPVTGALLASGLIYGLFRLRDRRRGLLWLWVVIALAGGYLSELHADSPTSFRTITVVPAVALITADVLGRMSGGIMGAFSEKKKKHALVVATIIIGSLLVFATWWEVHTYFVKQAHDIMVQNSFNQIETQVGYQTVEAIQEGKEVYMSPRFYYFSPLRFLVYSAFHTTSSNNILIEPPFREIHLEFDLLLPSANKDVVLLLDNTYMPLIPYIRSYYPHMQVQQVTGPGMINLFLRLDIPAADIEKLDGFTAAQLQSRSIGQQGLTGTFYPNVKWEGNPVDTRLIPIFLLSWSEGEPLPSPFSAEFTGKLRIEKEGTYLFTIEADDGARLIIDGKTVGESLIPNQPNQIMASLDLTEGLHPIQIDYFQGGGASTLEFLWQPPDDVLGPVPPENLIPVSL